ncbi:flagellar filament capping protein FliD [Modestobacter sp. Leaf380]|uniref:flagellar filament capping protein FliD n=1 Tax=Modestobacter sp. Leaf380 TaxID=1736356 RepID=UPI0006F3E32F|nr:flagellar filament capping protein FliD [Modestobacter sp. Leaf380]KQS68384.1 hypothetical protein ASG41_05135 [Modestobacter sp. Leaf380]
MVTLGVDGLVSGLETSSIITNIMKVEAQPQALLKTQLSATQAKAAAYRAVNTRFDAIRTAAEALTSTSLAAARTATSSSSSVTASATPAAVPGSSVSFRVEQLATSKQVTSDVKWTSATAPVREQSKPAWPITVLDSAGLTVGTIDLPAGATLADAVSAINASGYGVHAAILQLGPDEFRLQLTSDATGQSGARRLQSSDETADTAETGFLLSRAGQDAKLSLEGAGGLVVTSSSNTFSDVLTGLSITVSKADPTADATTVRIGADTSAITTKVKALVDAANGALGVIKGFTVSTAGAATATLQGDRALVQLSDSLLSAVSTAIGGKSAASIGLQLNRDGTIAFDSAVLTAKLASDPAGVAKLLSGSAESTTAGVTTPAVTGIAGKLAALARTASDSSTGTLVALAKGRETLADTIKDRIDGFEIRLAARQETLTKQFTALEQALSRIKNQSTWLTSQVNQLYNPNAS